jgi:hypothetical protein
MSSVNPSYPGESVTFTATVHSTNPPPDNPTGTFTFYNGISPLGTSGMISGNTATFPISTLTEGIYSNITAQYSGDSTYATSTSVPFTQTVQINTSITTPISSSNPSTFGSPVMFTVSVNANPVVGANAPGNGGGGVTFYDSSTPIGSGNVVSNSASFTTSLLSVGMHSITAQYQTDGVYLTSPVSSALSQNVNAASSAALWMFGDAPGSFNVNTTLFIFDPVSLNLNSTTLGSTFGSYDSILYPTYLASNVWAIGNLGSGNSKILKFSTSGTLLSTISTTLPAGNASMTSDGANTLYIAASNGGLYSYNTSTSTFSTLYTPSGTPEYAIVAYDSSSGTLCGPLDFTVTADATRVSVFKISGSTNTFVTASGNSTYGDNQVVNGNGYDWVGANNGYPGGPSVTSFQFVQINPSTNSYVTTISPPGTAPIASAPAPYYYGLQATMCYNSSTNMVYVVYVAVDNTLSNARIDQINASTGAISTLTSSMPLAKLGDVCACATNGNYIWTTDSVSKVTSYNTSTTTITSSAAVNDGVGNAGCLCYVP